MIARVGVAVDICEVTVPVPSDQTRASVQLDGIPPTSYIISRLRWPLIMRRAPEKRTALTTSELKGGMSASAPLSEFAEDSAP